MDRKRKLKTSKAKTIALAFAGIYFGSAVAAWAHDGKPHNFEDLLRTWAFDPIVLVPLSLSAVLYSVGVWRLWSVANRGSGIEAWHALAFASGWISLFVALVSPLHPWGEVLFSAHMTQHEILMLISAPLLVLGRPLIASVWALPAGSRRPITGFFRKGLFFRAWRFATNPIAAWFIHAAALWIWHIPQLFQATLTNNLVHTLQHASFFGSALLFWWAIIYTPRSAASYGAGILYLFTTFMHSGILGAFLTFTTTVWYPAYSGSTSSWGLSPLEDQQLGGLIMWAPAGLVYIAAALLMFAGWLRQSEKNAIRHDEGMFGRSATSKI